MRSSVFASDISVSGVSRVRTSALTSERDIGGLLISGTSRIDTTDSTLSIRYRRSLNLPRSESVSLENRSCFGVYVMIR